LSVVLNIFSGYCFFNWTLKVALTWFWSTSVFSKPRRKWSGLFPRWWILWERKCFFLGKVDQ